jgi:hypothetical protein
VSAPAYARASCIHASGIAHLCWHQDALARSDVARSDAELPSLIAAPREHTVTRCDGERVRGACADAAYGDAVQMRERCERAPPLAIAFAQLTARIGTAR